MDIHQREIATAAAAQLVLSNLQRVLSDTSTPKKEIAASAIPVFGTRWGALAIRRVTARRLRNILLPLRNSKLDNANYRRIRVLWKEAHLREPDFPVAWGGLAFPD